MYYTSDLNLMNRQKLDKEDKFLEIEEAFSKHDIAEPKVRGVKKLKASGEAQASSTVDKFKDSKYWEDEDTDQEVVENTVETYAPWAAPYIHLIHAALRRRGMPSS